MDRIRVLIADDEEHIRDSLVAVVASDPSLEVVGTASDARTAIELAASTRPDVALLDVRMPGGGPRAAGEISRRCAPTRVVALSAHEDRRSVLAMINAGASGYVGKAATNEEILRAIHGTAEGTSELSPNALNEVFHAFAEAVEEPGPPADDRRMRERIERIIERRAVDVVFQPIADLDDLGVVGVEALAGFRTRPRRPPEIWLAEASELGLRLDLERVAVQAALDQVDEVPEGVFLAVNLSPEAAGTPDVLEAVGRSVPERIVLELTERAPVEDYGSLREGLEELRARGLRVAVDDAGAAFSSLRHVVRLSPDLIKLNMSLIRDLASDPTRQALVSSLLGLARDIGATVIADGVETEREVQALRWLGVPLAQGEYLARWGRIPEAGGAWGRTTPAPGVASPSVP